MSGHVLVWEFELDSASVTAVCNEAPDADCRLHCNGECETFSEIVRHQDVTLDGKVANWITHDDCQGVMQPGECNVCLFLNESDCIEESTDGHPRFEIGRVAIEPVWEGDYYNWRPAVTT